MLSLLFEVFSLHSAQHQMQQRKLGIFEAVITVNDRENLSADQILLQTFHFHEKCQGQNVFRNAHVDFLNLGAVVVIRVIRREQNIDSIFDKSKNTNQ